MSNSMILEVLDKDWEDSDSNLSNISESESSRAVLETIARSEKTSEEIDSGSKEVALNVEGVNRENPAEGIFLDIENFDSLATETRYTVHVDVNRITPLPDSSKLFSLTNVDPLSCAQIVPVTSSISDAGTEATQIHEISAGNKDSNILTEICEPEKLDQNAELVKAGRTAQYRGRKKKSEENSATKVPSVYSYSEIQRHKRRLTLKALQEDSSSDSDSKSNEDNLDPDLDVNLRIFEANSNSVDNVIIGEIHCDVVEDKNNSEANNEKQAKNIFKLSVNAGLSEKSQEKNENTKENICDDTDDEDIEGFSSVYDDDCFSDDDSDLEILTSKSIVRKRASLPSLKKDRPTDSDKITMFDLIYDAVQPAPKPKANSNVDKCKQETKKTDSKKTKKSNSKKLKTSDSKKTEMSALFAENKSDSTKTEISKPSDPVENNKTNDALPVPQLKVNADGQVIIDMDSLMIEQTGVAEAREAIANSEIVEESGLTYKSYSRKTVRKQWSPHDTLKFYDVLSVVGTDFSLMATLFPDRTRNCIKRKFKKEEKTNAELILKALTCRQKFNIGLLEKELKLKEEKVKLLRQNSKPQKPVKEPPVKKPKKVVNRKRRSFFEKSVNSFQETCKHSTSSDAVIRG